MRIRLRFVAASLAIGLLAGPSMPALAQQLGPCPIVTDPAAANALGGPVQTSTSPNTPPGLDWCDFVDSSGTDYAVSRATGAFQPGEPTGAAVLVLKFVSSLPADAQTQVLALNTPGTSVSVPGYEFSSLNGLGDAAVWIKAQSDSGSGYDDSLLIQRGNDVFALDALDGPDTQTKLNALAQAVLTNAGAGL